MMLEIRITDITAKASSKYLYECPAPIPFKKYRRKLEYLKAAIPRNGRQRLLMGVSFCLAHPLYNPESLRMAEIMEEI